MHQLHVNANQHKYWLDNEIFVEDKRLKSLEVHIGAVVVRGHHGMGNEKWQPVISPYTQARYHFPSWLQEQLPAPVCTSPSTLSLINTLLFRMGLKLWVFFTWEEHSNEVIQWPQSTADKSFLLAQHTLTINHLNCCCFK